MSKITSKSGQNLWVLANCPETGEEVVGKGSNERISTADKKGMWWSCPACRGWHVIIVKDKAHKKLEDDPEITTYSNFRHRLQVRSNSHKLRTIHRKENPFVEQLSPFSSHSSIHWAY